VFDEQSRAAAGDDGRSGQAPSPQGVLEDVLNEQRRDWMSGKGIRAAELLRRHAAVSSNIADAADLIYHEYLLRSELGESPVWEEYLQDFPLYAERLRFLRQADQLVARALGAGDPVKGTAQLGDYELLEELGQGGMGVVFKARQRKLNRFVAVKMIRSADASDKEGRKRFENEAQAVARLQHPNIVQIYEVGQINGRPFLALEFVEGQNLARHLDGTPLSARRAASLVETLARAIHYAHEKQIIHRDLKPSNVLVAGTLNRGLLKITDFGLAKQLDVFADTRTFGTVGTPSYMAPEQVDVKIGPPDRRTDVYGLGAILYELLTGRPPFRAETPLQTLKQVAGTEPARPRLLNPAVPRDLETVCLKCLEKEPAQRYGSAAALADDLARFVKGEPVLARPIGPGARLMRWCRLNPVVASLTAVLVLALVGGISGIVRQWRQAELERRNAVASDLEAQQLLSELIASSPVVPGIGYRVAVPSVEPLLKAAAHCKNYLEKNPGNLQLRIALTNVYGRLGTLYAQRRKMGEREQSLQDARALWEPLVRDEPANPVYRSWLATTCEWHQQYGFLTCDFESTEQANRLWEELAEEQPANLDFMEKVRHTRRSMFMSIFSNLVRDAGWRRIQDIRIRLATLVQNKPDNTLLRKRLALACMQLAEVSKWEPSLGQPSSFWQEAHDHYRILACAKPDDILVKVSLADCSRRLIHGQSQDPYYREAVSVLKQAGQSLAALLKQNPDRDWLREALLEDYCGLAVCHSKVDRNADAAKVIQDDLEPLIAALSGEHADPASRVVLLQSMSLAGNLLWQGQQPAAALAIDRQAAALTIKYAANSLPDPGLLSGLGGLAMNLSANLNQLGDAALALRMAELGRNLVQEASRVAPEGDGFDHDLCSAWERIAKAHWSLHAHDQALAAFRESAALEKRFFERDPSSRAARKSLSRCYDRLVDYSCRGGDLAGAAAALLEREKLWPGDAAQLTLIANDFKELAKRVDARAKGHLSPQDQAEKAHYLAERERVRRAAKQQGAAAAPTVIGDRS
jgi:tRNA A-37 threonylcarbamoyl transferase component Bud32